jgi:hypothetical protein
MQWEIVYAVPGTTDTWAGKPGRLYTPVPRTAEEAGKALEYILQHNPLAEVTSTPLIETQPTKP